MILKFAKPAFLAVALSTNFVPSLPLIAHTSHVQFQRGSDTATLSGTITGAEYADYKLRANAGQKMSVALTILPPGSSGEAIFNGSTSPERYGQVTLPKNGDYTIRVYLMGNDRDTDKTVGYTVSVTIR